LVWLENHPVLFSLVTRLQMLPIESQVQIEKIVAEASAAQGCLQPGFYSAASVEEHAALCLHITRAAAKTITMEQHTRDYVLCNLAEYLTGQTPENPDEALKPLRDVAVDGIYEYMDEQIDTRNVIYSILLKYKQRSEWFRRARLRVIADEGQEGGKGERGLARDLQEYVFGQHIEFIVEPTSSSGEAHLILREPGGRYLVIDAKYVPVDATRSVIRDQIGAGFHQVARYCEDFREPEGFLVSFIRAPKRISLELEESDGLNFLKIGGKTIYYLAVQISDEPSASKSGKADEVVIAKEELASPVPE
jgi:hypothetical protein